MAPGGMSSLQVIKPTAQRYTVEYLRPVVGSAKIFIRPLQQDLDIDVSSVDVVSSDTTFFYAFNV